MCLCHLSMAAMRRDPFTTFALYAGLLPEQLPHQRALCPLHPFQATARLDAAPVEGNEAACPNCYCLVCDVRVSECRHWQGGDPAHCNAHGDSAEWHQKRVNAKRHPPWQRERRGFRAGAAPVRHARLLPRGVPLWPLLDRDGGWAHALYRLRPHTRAVTVSRLLFNLDGRFSTAVVRRLSVSSVNRGISPGPRRCRPCSSAHRSTRGHNCVPRCPARAALGAGRCQPAFSKKGIGRVVVFRTIT